MKPWIDTAITTLLRVGVLLSLAIILAGMVITFMHHPTDVLSRPALHTIGEVVDGVRDGRGQAIMMAGLLVLIATPIARVALSVVIFIIERDRLFALITSVVFAILVLAFAKG